MRILMVDKFHFIRGGAERYMFDLKDLLESRGNRVIPFSMKHPSNIPSAYSEYFVDPIEFNLDSGWQKAMQGFRIVGRVVYSWESRRKIERLIRMTRPDVAHLHMIDHQISPSILDSLAQAGIPMIQTAHQYKLVCPNYRLYIEHRNRICEKCLGRKFHHAILERCHKHSLAASALIGVESAVHHLLHLYDAVGLFHAPSRFLGEKLVQGGVPAEKVRHLMLTFKMADYATHPGNEGYYVYYGRLSCEKGIDTLLRAVEKVKSTKRCLIIGEGPEKDRLMRQAQNRGLSQVVFLGYKSGAELRKWVSNAMFVVVPSEWYENSPLTIYESFAMGKPVVASRIGGIPEFVEDGRTGYLFPPGNDNALASRIAALSTDSKALHRFGKAARDFAETHFAPVNHYDKIMGLYHSVMNGSPGRGGAV